VADESPDSGANSTVNPLRVKFKMVDDAQIFNIWTPISFERLKLETSNLVIHF